MIDVRSDRHLWAQNYDRTLEDIFAIQSDIANRVAESLESQLLPGKKHRIENANTRDIDAHLLVFERVVIPSSNGLLNLSRCKNTTKWP